tara:strand:- start:136 stop:1791 length:1656 start_codon:yes stop_codon:yes gene_type:complete
MAQIKIYQSELGAKVPTIPEVAANLALPYELATQKGTAFSKLGQAIKDIRDKRKETQDENDAIKIIREIDLDLGKKFESHQRSSKIDDVTTFYTSTDLKKYQSNFKKHKANKRVKQLVGNHLFKEQSAFGQKLIAKITLNHLNETKARHVDELNEFIFKMAANDPDTRRRGYKELNSWFLKPTNIDKYTEADFKKLKEDTLAQARKFQLAAGIRNDPMSVINNIDNIKIEFGWEEGESILKDAANSFVSKQISKDLDEIQAEKADTSEKIANFAEVVRRLNNKNDIDYLKKIPTLDDINDLWKLDQINSAQYAALIDFYDNPNKVSDDRIVDMINAQLAVAQSVEDLDVLQRQINFDAEFVTRLGIKDWEKFEAIFEKYKADQPGLLNYQHFHNILDTDLGKIENSGGYTLGGSATDEKKQQKTRINGMKMYRDLTLGGLAPEDAYVQTIKRYTSNKTMPTIYNVIQPMSISITTPEKGTVKDPAKFFEDKRKEVLEKYKTEPGVNINMYMEDLSAIDVMEDLFKVRLGIGDIDFAFSDKQDASVGAVTTK